nr:hypothetical protein Iba_chr14fCG13250 [Ipomoea batatas]
MAEPADPCVGKRGQRIKLKKSPEGDKAVRGRRDSRRSEMTSRARGKRKHVVVKAKRHGKQPYVPQKDPRMTQAAERRRAAVGSELESQIAEVMASCNGGAERAGAKHARPTAQERAQAPTKNGRNNTSESSAEKAGGRSAAGVENERERGGRARGKPYKDHVAVDRKNAKTEHTRSDYQGRPSGRTLSEAFLDATRPAPRAEQPTGRDTKTKK